MFAKCKAVLLVVFEGGKNYEYKKNDNARTP